MGCRVVRADDLEAEPGSHPASSPYDKAVGGMLGLHDFAVYQVELPPFARSTAHDHAQDGVEDMYAVIAGGGRVVVDDSGVAIEPGMFVAITPESTRYVEAGEHGLVYIAVCSAR